MMGLLKTRDKIRVYNTSDGQPIALGFCGTMKQKKESRLNMKTRIDEVLATMPVNFHNTACAWIHEARTFYLMNRKIDIERVT